LEKESENWETRFKKQQRSVSCAKQGSAQCVIGNL